MPLSYILGFLGFPLKIAGAVEGSRDVVPVLQTRIEDLKNVLHHLKKDSSGTFDHEVTRLGNLLAELEASYAKHVAGDYKLERVMKAASRTGLHPEIRKQARTIDEAVIRQFTAVAAKSAIGGQQTTGVSSLFPAPAGDPERKGFEPRLWADDSKPATRPGEGSAARNYTVSTWSGRQRTVYVVVCGGRCAPMR